VKERMVKVAKMGRQASASTGSRRWRKIRQAAAGMAGESAARRKQHQHQRPAKAAAKRKWENSVA